MHDSPVTQDLSVSQAASPRSAAHVAQLREHALLTRLIALAEARVYEMRPRELGSVSWALARLERRPRDLLYAVEGDTRAVSLN